MDGEEGEDEVHWSMFSRPGSFSVGKTHRNPLRKFRQFPEVREQRGKKIKIDETIRKGGSGNITSVVHSKCLRETKSFKGGEQTRVFSQFVGTLE